jgi:2-hydroxychromene-2-carboxylate isomerase
LAVAKSVDFIFDLMSPYSYLAASQLEGLEKRTGATFNWSPIFLPGLMKAVGNKGPLEVPFKAFYAFKDINDWAKHYGLPELQLPDAFPFHAVVAQRAFIAAAEQGKGPAFGLCMFRLIWHERCAANDEAVLTRALEAVGLDAKGALVRSKTDAVKEKLRANTDAAIERKVFGVPTFFVGDEMFVGNDRLTFVERALCR